MQDNKPELLMLGFMQVGPDILTFANCKYQLQFQHKNNCQFLYITSTKFFNQQRIGQTSRKLSG